MLDIGFKCFKRILEGKLSHGGRIFPEKNRVSIKENKETNMNQVEQKSRDESLLIIFIIIIKLEKGRNENFSVMENLENFSSRKFLSKQNAGFSQLKDALFLYKKKNIHVMCEFTILPSFTQIISILPLISFSLIKSI